MHACCRACRHARDGTWKPREPRSCILAGWQLLTWQLAHTHPRTLSLVILRVQDTQGAQDVMHQLQLQPSAAYAALSWGRMFDVMKQYCLLYSQPSRQVRLAEHPAGTFAT